MMDSSGAHKYHDYIRALEEERKKIEMFQRELPLCLQLVTQAIENVKRKMLVGGDEETTNDVVPMLAEFLPLRPSLSLEDDEDDEGSIHVDIKSPERQPDDKPDWLRCVQLWKQQPDHSAPKMDVPKKPIAVNVTKIGGAFQPFEKEKYISVQTQTQTQTTSLPVASSAPLAAASSSTSTENGDDCGGGSDNSNTEKKEEKEKEGQSQSQLQTNRKARRCWSQELHRRFLNAIQQLGGSHAATPKQIRELMKVDGLTNDEVKSHLQKYRLHTRRPSPQVQGNSNSNHPTPSFVVVGGIWVPPPDYAVVAAASAAQPTNPSCAPNEIYVPVASHPKHRQQNKKQSHGSPTGPLSSDKFSDDDNNLRDSDHDAFNSISPSSSSSS